MGTQEPIGGGSTATATSVYNLTALVPTFDPSKDDLEQYTQKVELLSDIWPRERMNELITRLILNTNGAAFQKLQLIRDKLKTGDADGVKLLITTLGGQWGRIGLERKYEIVERAVYRSIQRPDESNDSFLARTDVAWTELLSKSVTLAEIQAYTVLRGSQLTADDKKRVIQESAASASGALSMEKVTEAVRMLGAGFFQDLTGQKRVKRKIYEPTALFAEGDEPDHEEDPYQGAYVTEEITEDDFMQQLLNEEDSDAVLIADYESAAADHLQSDEDLSAAYNTYADARRRLSERFKSRGFWPITKQKGKGATSGKGRGKNKGQRKSLQQRIMESRCRICNRVGHWKAECPERNRASGSNAAMPSSTAMVTTVDPLDSGEPIDALPLEFIQLPLHPEPNVDVPDLQVAHIYHTTESSLWDRIRQKGNRVSHHQANSAMPRTDDQDFAKHQTLRQADQRPPRSPSVRAEITAVANFATTGACGILDTGATKSVIGSNLLSSFLNSLNAEIRDRLSRTACNITFRFGNSGTLTSRHAIIIPLKNINLGLKIAIVPGNTPLLLSNTLVRTLRASIDSHRQVLQSPLLSHHVPLQLSSRGLYLVDVNDLVAQSQGSTSANAGPTETFLTTSEEGKNETIQNISINDKACEDDGTMDTHSHKDTPHEHVPSQVTCKHVTDDATEINTSCTYQHIHTEKDQSIDLEGARGEALISQHSNATNQQGPKSVSDDFLGLLRRVSHQHVPAPAPRSCADILNDDSGRHEQLPSAELGGDGQHLDHLRQDSHRQVIPGDVADRTPLDSLVRDHIRIQRQDRAQEVSDIRGSHGRTSRIGAWPRRSSHRSRPEHHRSQDQSEGKGQELSSFNANRASSPRRRLGMGRDECQYAQPGKHRGPSDSHAAPGIGSGRDPEPCAPQQLSASDAMTATASAGDHDLDFQDAIANVCDNP